METRDKIVVRGELALVLAVLINSFAVAVTVYAGLGISPVSSFPYAVSLVFPFLTLGTWTYLFQGVLVITLMVLAQAVCAVVPVQLCGGLFLRQAAGCVWCVAALPTLQLGLAHLLLCGQLPGHRAGHCAVQPVQAADHPDGSVCPGPFGDYPQALRQGQDDHGPDLRCGIHCADRSGYRYAKGVGIGTVVAALTYGRTAGLIGNLIDKKFYFVSVLEK